MKFLTFLIILLSACIVLPAQDAYLLQYAETITKEELSEHVHYLASDELGGRFTGTEGQRMAATYIAAEFHDDGLTPPYRSITGPFTQRFYLGRCSWESQNIKAGEVSLAENEDFTFLSEPADIEGDFSLVFGGFGISDPAYSDLSALDIAGRVVVVISGEPRKADGTYLLSGNREPSSQAAYTAKARKAEKMGAVGLVVVSRDDKDFKQYVRQMEKHGGRDRNLTYPDSTGSRFFVMYSGMTAGAALLGTTEAELSAAVAAMDNDRVTQAGKFSGQAYILAKGNCRGVETENILGMVLGTDLPDEAVVVVAHYDHLGVRDGKLFPGADDNASGTAAVMEIAEAFAQAARDGLQPRRTVIFLAVTAEEIGLYGSRYYTENPLVPMSRTYACLNIDMIGRVSEKMKATPDYIGGWAYLSENLLAITNRNNAVWAPGLTDRMEFRENARGGSDHYYFARQGVPSLFYFTGIHKDYHDPGDTPSKLLYDRMEQTVRAIFGNAWELANSEKELMPKK